MTLYRQMFLFIFLLCGLLFIAASAIKLQSTRAFLEEQLGSHAQDTATSLGLSILPHIGEGDLATLLGIPPELPNARELMEEGLDYLVAEADESDGSFLKLTSLGDGAVQTQHLVHVAEWRETSAYFNGDAVLVELWAQPGTGDNRLILGPVTAGPAIGVATICGATDDRVLSYDNRAARTQPTGCTAWVIDDCQHCFLTAGHCSGSGLQVVEFNVPLSTSSGSLQHPPPQDQYSIDQTSVQTNGGLGVGDDWAYFGVFANSTTGLTPYQAYGGLAFALQPTPPAVAGQDIRITGYGTVSSPVSTTWKQVQKTHAGPYAVFSGTTVQYVTDTTGGNSGSPVILDGTNQAIGIHTHGGCSTTGGQNSGTGSNHPGLQNALANPLGVCVCPAITFSYPNGLPTMIAPNGSTTVRVAIGGLIPLQAGTVRCHVSTGGAFQTLVPTAIGANLFEVAIPPSACYGTVQVWFSAQDTVNNTFTDPANAPAAVYSATTAQSLFTLRYYNFNTTPPAWIVTNTNLSTGPWERGTPVDPRGPAADADGSGQCWVTGNANNVDVDGGPTVLRTEAFDLSATADPWVRYALWLSTTDSDQLVIEASQNGGASWVPIASLSEFSGWQHHGFRVRDHFATPGLLTVRFAVADQPNNSVTEAGLDAFRIEDLVCAAASWTTFGAGCPGSNGIPQLSATTLPALGTTFQLGVTSLGGGAAFLITGLGQQTVPLQQYGFAAGCTLLATTESVQFLAQNSGTASSRLSIPSVPALFGMHLFQQVVEIAGVSGVSAGGDGVIR